jgi:hypothetical protein
MSVWIWLFILANVVPPAVAGAAYLLWPRRTKFVWDVAAHKWAVARGLLRLSAHLAWRAFTHDLSKLRGDEARGFSAHLPGLKGGDYGSEAYTARLRADGIAEAVGLHYDRNRHHPQHFDRGVRAMTIVDLAEMLADWAAASSRMPGGSLNQSFNVNRSRFSLDYATLLTLENTARRHFRREYRDGKTSV